MRSLKILLMFVILFTNMVAIGQTFDAQKQAMIEKMLEEKLLPNYKDFLNKPEAKLTKTTNFDQRISTTGSGYAEGEVSIAVDPADSNKLVLSYMEQSSAGLRFPIYYSSNGGQTWALSSFSAWNQLAIDFPGHNLLGGGDPAFAWDKNGKLYFAWIYLTMNATQDTAFFTLNWASSADNGASFTVAPGVNHFIGRGAINPSNNHTFNYFDGITDREWLAVDNSNGPNQGNLYCSFVNFPPGNSPTVEAIKVKTPSASGFGPRVAAYQGTTQFGNVEVDKNGVLHLSCADVGYQKMVHVSSTNGGASFGSSASVAYGVSYQPQTHVVHNRDNSAPNLAAGGGGELYMAWSDFPGGVTNSYFARSVDGGNSWQTRSIDSLIGKNGYTLMPTVAASGNKVTISVTAYGNSTDFFADTANFYQLASMDSGKTFSNPVLISSLPTDYTQYLNNSFDFFGDYARSVAFGCNVYATWSDGRSQSGPKIYFSKTNSCSFPNTTGIKEVTKVNSNIQLETMYPNPAKGVGYLSLNVAEPQTIVLQLSDALGKNILKQANTLHKGIQELSLPLNDLAPGMYIVSLSDPTGLVASRSLIVN